MGDPCLCPVGAGTGAAAVDPERVDEDAAAICELSDDDRHFASG
jgi:hypothetical protein